MHRNEGIFENTSPALLRVGYQRAAAGCKPTVAVFLRGVAEPQRWMEERLGPLAWFEMEDKNEAM